ncbi:DUF4476 domain-containing protein [Pontibacter sp. G13]|uniref:DUF4476 domain-containing protein n=1 Tax=Pontibacter sp. G13 TaxID=3074898 RepID=UPI00288A26A0|nr:DUF4476 domain-containing protein [Pontibacter sp. G13]WNJ19745.1 DUF4476 domain-containing protein [Pontibacter sp. G13]
MNRISTLLTLALAFFCFLPSKAHPGQLVVQTTDGKKFFLMVDNREQNHRPASRVEVNDLGRMKYRVSVRFENPRMGVFGWDDVQVRNDYRSIYHLVPTRRGYVLDLMREEPIRRHQTPPRNPRRPSGPQAVCSEPMDRDEFQRVMTVLDRSTFDSDKMEVLKRTLSRKCVGSRQVRRMAQQLSHESNKVKFAKKAWLQVTNPESYEQVLEVFSFRSSVREMRQFMYNNPRNTYPDHDYDQDDARGGHYDQDDASCQAPQQPRNPRGPRKATLLTVDQEEMRFVVRKLRGMPNDFKRMDYLEHFLDDHAMTSNQVARIMSNLDHESNKVKIAKQAYTQVQDPHGYDVVLQQLQFQNSRRELRAFIRNGNHF